MTEVRVRGWLAMPLLLLCAAWANADEGMWTLDHLPLAQMQQRYGFALDPAWIARVQRATVRLAQGCSGSFVSANGLVMTNHHCANTCLSQLSGKGRNYMANGYSAARREDEAKCPEVELNQLQQITDVTQKVHAATAGKQGAERIKAERAINSQIEKQCVGNDAAQWRCDVVSLYHGGRYALHKYHRYQDVRLVFAPEQSIAFFGGDPDNFNFPRYDLDVTFFRAYVDGKPATTPDYLPFAAKGPKAGEMTFVVGNPGSTMRQVPWLQLSYMRDKQLIPSYGYRSELRGLLWQYSRLGAEQAKQAQDALFGVDNTLKVYGGLFQTLASERFSADKQAQDLALRKWIGGDPARTAKYGDPWAQLGKAQQAAEAINDAYTMIENGLGFDSQLYSYARLLVRAATERTKPDTERLPAYRDANLPALEQEITSTAPIYPQYEQTTLSWSLEKLRQRLGADDAFVHAILGNQSPDQLAHEWIYGSQLADPARRLALWKNGQTAIQASTDPMIKLALRIDPQARTIRKQYEESVEAPTKAATENIAKALFERDGLSRYPDATFSPRLTFGKVIGWKEKGREVPPFTHLSGLFQRATGSEPFALPKRWLDAKSKLDLNTPMNFVTDNDIIGGNSGSPVINRQGQAVGLIFDGNIHSLGGDFLYDGSNNRAVAVDTAALLESLRVVYQLPELANELDGRKP